MFVHTIASVSIRDNPTPEEKPGSVRQKHFLPTFHSSDRQKKNQPNHPCLAPRFMSTSPENRSSSSLASSTFPSWSHEEQKAREVRSLHHKVGHVHPVTPYHLQLRSLHHRGVAFGPSYGHRLPGRGHRCRQRPFSRADAPE